MRKFILIVGILFCPGCGDGPDPNFPKGMIIKEKYKTEEYEIIGSYNHSLYGTTIEAISTTDGERRFFNEQSGNLEKVEK